MSEQMQLEMSGGGKAGGSGEEKLLTNEEMFRKLFAEMEELKEENKSVKKELKMTQDTCRSLRLEQLTSSNSESRKDRDQLVEEFLLLKVHWALALVQKEMVRMKTWTKILMQKRRNLNNQQLSPKLGHLLWLEYYPKQQRKIQPLHSERRVFWQILQTWRC